MEAATGKERRPTVAIDDVPEPAAGVMRTSAADDDETNQQREPADSASILSLVIINKTIMGVVMILCLLALRIVVLLS